MAEHELNQRRQLLVDRPFQLRVISWLALILLVDLALFVGLAIAGPIAFGFLIGEPSPESLPTRLQVDTVLLALVLPLLCTFLCLFAQGLRVTFRIAGPCYRFRQVFRDLAELQIPRGVRIRETDFLQETAKELDQCLRALHEEVLELRTQAQEAFHRMEDSDVARSHTDPHLRQAMLAVEESVEEGQVLCVIEN